MTDVGTHAQLEQRKGYPDPTPCDGRMLIDEQFDRMWIIVCDKCGFEAGLPARAADPNVAERILTDDAGFPRRFIATTVEETPDNKPTLKALRGWLRQYDTGPIPAPALFGQAGRGKSQLLVATCQRLIREQNVRVLFRSSSRLLDEMQQQFDRPDENAGLWQRALTVPVLALDDMGAERATDWREDRLARLVDERWERELPVLIATNYGPTDWQRAFGARTASRLAGMTFALELMGPDRRQMAITNEERIA
jgi:chromosomal replication initiation ATPase DnaA